MVDFIQGATLVAQGIGLATDLAGAFVRADAHEDEGRAAKATARAFEDEALAFDQSVEALRAQAAQLEALTAEEQGFIREQALREAGLIEAAGGEEGEVLLFNEGVARANAEWERRAGDVAFRQLQRRWERHVSTITARFAASGTTLTGTTNDVILGQIGEMEEDLFLTELNTQRAVAIEEDQAGFYSLRRRQLEARTRRQAAARLSLGDIEADITGLEGEASVIRFESATTEAAARAAASRSGAAASRSSAAAARSRARSAEIGGFADLFRSGARLASSDAFGSLFDDKVPG